MQVPGNASACRCPLVDPEDLLEARIVRCTPRAESLGIQAGMSGREAVELMLQASGEMGD